jgi:hypothetical protein
VFSSRQRVREVGVVRLDRGLDVRQRNRAVRRVVQRLRLHAAEHRGASGLQTIGVRLLADDVLVAASAVRHHADQVRLRPRRQEHGGLEAEQRRDLGFERVDGGIVAEDVVADERLRHRRAHLRRGPRHRVAAKIGRHQSSSPVACIPCRGPAP